MSDRMTNRAESLSRLSQLLDAMNETVRLFHQLLRDEQQAIRTLSFGQFTDVTEKKSRVLDQLRDLEQERRRLTAVVAGSPAPSSSTVETKQQELTQLIAAVDRENRLNAALIGQSLAILHGSLSVWQQSPASAALYSSHGCMVSEVSPGRGLTG